MYPLSRLIIYEPIKQPRTINFNFNSDHVDTKYLVFNEDGSIADHYDSAPEFIDDADSGSEPEIRFFKNIEIQNFLLAYQPISVKKQKKINRIKKYKQDQQIRKRKNRQRKQKKKFSDLQQHFSEDISNLRNCFDFSGSCNESKNLILYNNLPTANESENPQSSTADYIPLSNGCDFEDISYSSDTVNAKKVSRGASAKPIRLIQWKRQSSNTTNEENHFIPSSRNFDANQNSAKSFFTKKFPVNKQNDQRKPAIQMEIKKNTFFCDASNSKTYNSVSPASANINSDVTKQSLDYIPVSNGRINFCAPFRGSKFGVEKFNMPSTGRYFNLSVSRQIESRRVLQNNKT